MKMKEEQLRLRKSMNPYEKSETTKSIKQIVNTFVPFILLWYLAYLGLSVSVWLMIPPAVVAAGFLVRIFIIFHDCCHNSFFKSRKANVVLGNISGIMTLFPFKQWQHSHNVHHAGSGNLDKRGVGDMWMLTVEEYYQASKWVRIQYRLYRNPLIMFGIGPIYAFLISNRFNRQNAGKKERRNTYFTNIAILAVCALMSYLVGWQTFLLIQGIIFYLSGVAGIWLFYVQHTFEDSYFEENEDWEYVKAAVEGSSYYQLPKLLQWMTGNIGYHHVHHLSPRVPNYKLADAHKDTKPLQHVPTITLMTSLKSLRFRLWDEQKKRFVTFREGKSQISLKSEVI